MAASLAAPKLFSTCHALADQSPVEPCFRQADIRIRGALVVQDAFGSLLRGLCPVYIDLFRPLKGGGHQSHSAVHNAEHAADTGGLPALTVGNDRGSAHAQGGDKIDVTGHDGQVAGGRADNEPLRVSVIDQAVRGNDF